MTDLEYWKTHHPHDILFASLVRRCLQLASLINSNAHSPVSTGAILSILHDLSPWLIVVTMFPGTKKLTGHNGPQRILNLYLFFFILFLSFLPDLLQWRSRVGPWALNAGVLYLVFDLLHCVITLLILHRFVSNPLFYLDRAKSVLGKCLECKKKYKMISLCLMDSTFTPLYASQRWQMNYSKNFITRRP